MASNTKKSTPIKERLIANSKQQGDCRIWTSQVDKNGYGHMTIGSRTDNSRKVGYRASRASYEAYKGEIPEGLIVRHTCDNPPCINPDHLIIGTYEDNAQDRVNRNRSNRDYNTIEHCAKISASKTGSKIERISEEIKNDIKEKLMLGISVAKTAKLIGISYNVVLPISKKFCVLPF